MVNQIKLQLSDFQTSLSRIQEPDRLTRVDRLLGGPMEGLEPDMQTPPLTAQRTLSLLVHTVQVELTRQLEPACQSCCGHTLTQVRVANKLNGNRPLEVSSYDEIPVYGPFVFKGEWGGTPGRRNLSSQFLQAFMGEGVRKKTPEPLFGLAAIHNKVEDTITLYHIGQSATDRGQMDQIVQLSASAPVDPKAIRQEHLDKLSGHMNKLLATVQPNQSAQFVIR